MNTRILRFNDFDKIHKLWTDTQGMGMRSLDDSKEGIEKFLVRNPNTCFISEENDVVTGVILCGHDGRRAYIYHATVALDSRKQGIGKNLVKPVIDALKIERIHKVALVVFKNNKLGNDFWEELNFENRTDFIY